MNRNLSIIFSNFNLLSTLERAGRYDEYSRTKQDVIESIHSLIRHNNVRYNQTWIEVRDLCHRHDIDTTELEVELSFSQLQEA